MTSNGDAFSAPLAAAAKYAQIWLDEIPNRGINPKIDVDQVRAAFGDVLPKVGVDATEVIERLGTLGEPGLMGMGSGRFFGWVIGGTMPAPLAADWLISTWDQNSGAPLLTPTVVTLEEIAGEWLLEILGLPKTAVVGFPTGAQMANFGGLIAGRGEVLARVGWDVNVQGLFGAPRIRVLVNEERHVTIDTSLRYLGLGEPEAIAADDQGRIQISALKKALESGSGPTILALQAGNIHSGSFEPFREAIELAHLHGAWVHVDGAFGLWALASPTLRPLLDGIELADSWATDAHKTLNVPYDCGVSIVNNAGALRRAFGVEASYLPSERDAKLWPSEKVAELSRRGRGVTVWAALLALGRDGVIELVDGLVNNAKFLAIELAKIPGCRVLNDVVFTQVSFAFENDERTEKVGAALIADHSIWISGSHWADQKILRISVSNWSTNAEDCAATISAVRRAAG
ncbi:MAG: pyridoxal-dependent decarboxylase [Actinomycetes bacterium]